jgi:signal transduction histidine kinase/CheY-like chemotaxis protein
MQVAPNPANEQARLIALRSLEVLDTEPEPLYDDITELASQICDTPICLVSLVDSDRQWFKSRHGVDATQTPREIAFCSHAILGDGLFEVPDSRIDSRFRDNPLVTGAPHVVFYAGFPLNLGDGLHVGTLCVIDQKPKTLTEKQRQAMRCLANQVVSNLQLRRANRDIKRALDAKSRFLASMSHEIRTPLNGILGITNLLLEGARDKEIRDQLTTVRKCGDLLLSVINDILDFSKLESGKLTYEAHAFRPAHAVQGVCEVLQPLAARKGLGLRVDLGGVPEWIVGDATRLAQILMNLMGNAVKFSSSGDVALSVAAKPAGEGHATLTFSVADRGIGIPKERQAGLFTPYTQADASAVRLFGGSGLGLAIVKGLVEGMGGSLGLESEPGMGSRFWFRLDFPIGKAPDGTASEAEAGSTAPLATEKPMTILIVEDNLVNQMVAIKMASKLGYTADLAANGREALDMIRLKRYDLVLMDCNMPVMDGFEAAQRIQAEFPAGHRPTILALTAAVMEDERDRCLRSGMVGVLMKPMTLQALRRALLECPLPPR